MFVRPLIASIVFIMLSAPGAEAFPPYRSTDADTAGAGMLEVRLGLLQFQQPGSTSEDSALLSRINLGLGAHYEITSEMAYSLDDRRFGEGALGFKWARLNDGFGIGVETLALLPVNSTLSGAGIESQFLATVQRERWQVHMNAGGVYDPRSGQTEKSWRASILAEFPRGRLQPGLELFAIRTRPEATRVQAGIGIIAQFRRIEVRSGLHVGLSDTAPDVAVSFWLSWKWRVLGTD
jgi:hypothetical protein